MGSRKCNYCGFVGFADATECKRCQNNYYDDLMKGPSYASYRPGEISQKPKKKSAFYLMVTTSTLVGVLLVGLKQILLRDTMDLGPWMLLMGLITVGFIGSLSITIYWVINKDKYRFSSNCPDCGYIDIPVYSECKCIGKNTVREEGKRSSLQSVLLIGFAIMFMAPLFLKKAIPSLKGESINLILLLMVLIGAIGTLLTIVFGKKKL
jgi:hypothetical protein